MATVCATYKGGAMLRATRLNAAGAPVFGDCAQVVTDGFITMTLSAEVEEGEETTVTKANGQICLSEKACDQLKWYEVEIEYCEVDPDLITIMNPTWDKVLDAEGNTVGYNANGSMSCDLGYGLEVWLGAYGGGDSCGSSAGGSYGYMLMPKVVGGAPGDIEISSEDSITFSFTGRTTTGSNWGKGPYMVQMDVNGIPGRLLEPIGPDTHYRLFRSTVAPPESQCGCQPLDRPVPDPASICVQRMAGSPNTIRLRADNNGYGPVLIDFGDTTDVVEAPDGSWTNHTYAADGDYTITVRDKQTPAVAATLDISVPLADDEPTLALSQATPNDPYTARADIAFPAHATGEGTIDWGDGTDPEEFEVADDGSISLTHTYPANGLYAVTVIRDEKDCCLTFRARDAVLVPIVPGPILTTAADPADTTGMTTILTIDNENRGAVTVNWGDGTADEDGPAAGDVSHQYTTAGPYTITVTTANDPTSSASIRVEVPYALAPVVTVTPDTGATPLVTAITVDNHGQGPVTLSYSDGPTTEPNPGDNTTETPHTFTGANTYTVTATSDADQTAVGTATVTVS